MKNHPRFVRYLASKVAEPYAQFEPVSDWLSFDNEKLSLHDQPAHNLPLTYRPEGVVYYYLRAGNGSGCGQDGFCEVK